jgi:O-antigen/teichoic acid export membrane protein
MALALPVLTRLYNPEGFNLLAVYMAVVGIATAVSCLRLNIAIPLPEADEDGMALLVLSLLAATLLSLLLAAPVIAAPATVASFLGQPDIGIYLWMIPLGVWVASVYGALQYWVSRKRRFGLITATRMTRAIAGAGTQIGFGLASSGSFGLLFGHMVYGGMGIFGLLRSLFLRDRTELGSVNLARLRRSLLSYRRFPFWSVPEALFNTAGTQLPVIIIAAVAVGAEAGFVLLAMQVMGLPMGLIGASVAQVYLVEAGQKLRDGTLGQFTRRAMLSLLKIGAPPLLMVGVASPFLFGPVFGSDWSRAGVLVAWMTPWFILQFVASPISMVLHVTGDLVTAMALQAAGLVLRVGAVLGAMLWAPTWIAEIYALSGAAFYGTYLAILLFRTAHITTEIRPNA